MKKKKIKVEMIEAKPSLPCSTGPKMSAKWVHLVTRGDEYDDYRFTVSVSEEHGSATFGISGGDHKKTFSSYPNNGAMEATPEDLRCLARKLDAAADQLDKWGGS